MGFVRRESMGATPLSCVASGTASFAVFLLKGQRTEHDRPQDFLSCLPARQKNQRIHPFAKVEMAVVVTADHRPALARKLAKALNVLLDQFLLLFPVIT